MKTTMQKKNLQLAARNAMRKRLFTINGIDTGRIQLPNTAFQKPKTGIWIRESVNEGSEEPISNVAGREFAVVNYEIFGLAAHGADAVDAVAEEIRRVLPVVGAESVVYRGNGQSAHIRSIARPAGGIDNGDPAWYRRLVAVTLDLYNP